MRDTKSLLITPYLHTGPPRLEGQPLEIYQKCHLLITKINSWLKFSTGSGDNLQRRTTVQGPHAKVCLRHALENERSSNEVHIHNEESVGGRGES